MFKTISVETERTVALIGNPNVGKSTLFNHLCRENQHTGNWTGKTIDTTTGRYFYKGRDYALTDLPGTYSLLSCSEEERAAISFLQNASCDSIVVVVDGTGLHRCLPLALQIMELTDRMILCVNFLDEAERQKISIDCSALQRELGIPVVGISAEKAQGIEVLQETIRTMCDGFCVTTPKRLFGNAQWITDVSRQDKSDYVTERLWRQSDIICRHCLSEKKKQLFNRTDQILLSGWVGYFVLFLLLMGLFWLTAYGANIPSDFLTRLFVWLELQMNEVCTILPGWMLGLLVDGILHTTGAVIAVMLPPMVIFFFLFSFLEDWGVLPRAAFLMDHPFEQCGSCGKQALTMAMGMGCNAVGVTGCRIIASERERLLSILTNALVPCNGKFPALLVFISCLISSNPVAAAIVPGFIMVLCIAVTLLSTKTLSNFFHRERGSGFILEIPPYRKPNIRKILRRTFGYRTRHILGRAISCAAPMGALVWILSELNLLGSISQVFDPLGGFLGMNGTLLLAFLLSFPANELLLPMVLLISNTADVTMVINGWDNTTVICAMIFLLFHWPCATTCLTIQKETGKWYWVAAAILIPLGWGILLCTLIAHNGV